MMKKLAIIMAGAALLCNACFNPKKYDSVTPSGLITITSPDSTLVADGSTSYNVRATILDKNSDPSKRTVVFKTTLGTFKGGTDSIVVKADPSLHCSAKLISLKTGMASVSATIQKITAAKSATITFNNAYPTDITVAVDSFSVVNNNKNEASVTATLASGKGVPTIGTVVTFTAIDNTGQPIGTFLNNVNTGKTDANGQAKLRYAPINATYSGYVSFGATASGGPGIIVTGSTQIFVTH